MAERRRRFTARDAYNLMMRETTAAREDYEAARIAETIFALTSGADYQGSGAQAKNKSYVNSIGKGLSSGSASRYKMLQDADKEELAQMFTEEFNKALPGFTSIMDFNRWATTMGDWYQEDLRGKHSTIVRNALTGRKQKAIGDASNSFIKQHGTDWLSNNYESQQGVRQALIDEYGENPYFSLISKDVMENLKAMLSSQGQYTERDQKLQEDAATMSQEKWDAEQLKVSLQKSRDMVANDIVEEAAACYLAGGDREECLQKAKNKQSETYGNIVKEISEDVRKKFNAAVEKPTKLQTETYWDPELKEYVSATDQEARDQGLQPSKAGDVAQPKNLDKYYMEVGMEMAADPASGLTQEMWDYYRQDMDRINSVFRDRPQDVPVIMKWVQEVVNRRKKAATLGIDLNVLGSGSGEGSGIISVNPSN